MLLKTLDAKLVYCGSSRQKPLNKSCLLNIYIGGGGNLHYFHADMREIFRFIKCTYVHTVIHTVYLIVYTPFPFF